jgi:hypothetical protein
MPYTINKYNGSVVATVADGTIDATIDLKLIGKNYAGYGEVQNENFVYLLENFANTSSPTKPITGQLWYDKTSTFGLVFVRRRIKFSCAAARMSASPVFTSVTPAWKSARLMMSRAESATPSLPL